MGLRREDHDIERGAWLVSIVLAALAMPPVAPILVLLRQRRRRRAWGLPAHFAWMTRGGRLTFLVVAYLGFELAAIDEFEEVWLRDAEMEHSGAVMSLITLLALGAVFAVEVVVFQPLRALRRRAT